MILIVILIFLLFFFQKCFIPEDMSLTGGAKKASTITVIGPKMFIFYPKSTQLPKLLLFGEQHSDVHPNCKGIEMLDFTKEYIKRNPNTVVFLEDSVKINKICKHLGGKRANLVNNLYSMLKKDPKHYISTDTRYITPLCLFVYLQYLNELPKKDVKLVKDYFDKMFKNKNFKEATQEVIKILTDTTEFKEKFNKIPKQMQQNIEKIFKNMLNERSNKKYVEKYNNYKLNGNYINLSTFLLNCIALVSDIDLFMRIIISYQKDPNINIIVYYGADHIKNIKDIILFLLKIKSSISTKINESNCIQIPSIDKYI